MTEIKRTFPTQLAVAIGLLILSASFVVKHFTALPDFANGFMKGVGIGIMLFALIRQWYIKQNAT